MTIEKTSMIIDVIKNYPGSAEIFNKYNMGCTSCFGIKHETIEKGCMMHGIDVNTLMKDLKQLEQ